MRSEPALSIMLVVLGLLLWAASWGWLRFVKYPTDAHRDMAGRFTAWTFAFGTVVIGYLLLTLG